MIIVIKKTKLILMSTIFILCCSLFFITTNEVNASCTEFFNECNTCVITVHPGLKALACSICFAKEASCVAVYGPRK